MEQIYKFRHPMRILNLIILLFISVLCYSQRYAINNDNNIVIIIGGQSNAAGVRETDSVFNRYITNSNCKIWNGTAWEILNSNLKNNQYPDSLGFFAFEMSLGYSLQNYTKGTVYIIKYATGGKGMCNYWRVGYGGYVGLSATITDALTNLNTSAIPYTVIGMYWYQGESDANTHSCAVAYYGLLSTMLTQLRIDVGLPNLYYYLIRIHNKCPYPMEDILLVRAADSTFVTVDGGNSEWVSVDALGMAFAGSAHISSASQIILGNNLSTLTEPKLKIKKYHP